MRHVSTTDAQRQMERETRYGQKPPVGDSLDGVVSVFPAEADEIEAATRCVTRHAADWADRTGLLEALGLVETQGPKARTVNGKTTFGSGTCPFCLQPMQVDAAGLVLSHRRKGGACPGSGKEPKAEAPLADDPGAGKTVMEVPA